MLAEFLVENGLEYGYAEFWTAQATTVIADSKVKVRSIEISRKEGISAYTYQSNIYWFSDQDGVNEYFIALTEDEYSKASASGQWAELSPHISRELSCGEFRILVFSVNPMAVIYEMGE